MTITTTAPTCGVRADPLAAWSWTAASGLLTIVDRHGFATVYRVLELDLAGEAFELVAAGEDFGLSVVVLVTSTESLCSCADGDAPAPCEHRLALQSLLRNRKRHASDTPVPNNFALHGE